MSKRGEYDWLDCEWLYTDDTGLEPRINGKATNEYSVWLEDYANDIYDRMEFWRNEVKKCNQYKE